MNRKKYSWMGNYRKDDPQGMGSENIEDIQGREAETPRKRLVEDEFGVIVEETEVIEARTFSIYETSSNYCEIPTGPQTQSFDEFVKVWDLEVVDSNTVRAEWGNGEGYDTFQIEFGS